MAAVGRGGVVPDHPHVQVFMRTYAAFTAGDMEALAELVAEDVVWHTPGHNPLSGNYEGRDATFASFAREFELSGGTYAVELHDVLADDDHTVALLRCTAARDGKTLDMNYVLVFHIVDGRITEAWELWTDQGLLDEFWS
jgi:ketosteroid isomerase-like protein